jgi:uncharacterized DUF497 family protein
MEPWQGDVEWDEGNESELARHHITPMEVHQVLDSEPIWARNRAGRAGTHIVVGRTYGGRMLTIVVQLKDEGEVLRPIPGWDSSPGERTRYGRS